jgi:glycosyltransferase involved in cell wall biosynthesis
MPPRAEAPGAIPLVLNAQLVGLRDRHDVTLVTVAGDEPGELDAVSELERSGADVHVVDGRRPRGLARWRRRWRLASTWAVGRYPWRTAWFAHPDVQRTLDRLTSARQFDVAAIQDNSMAVFRLPPELPTVLTEHEVRQPRKIDWHAGPPSRWLRWAVHEADWRRWPRYQRAVWPRFDRVEVFTSSDERRVAALAPHIVERVRVNPFGIELPRPADPRREQSGLVVFTGNFSHQPNVDAATWICREIMPRLRKRAAGVRLALIGPAASSEVGALAGPDVSFLGEVPSIGPHLESASVVLAPVRTGGGMRMKVLYALGAGKAVVTTTRGTAGLELGGREPPLVVADDAETIARRTADLLNAPDLRRALGEQAHAFVQSHHSPDAYARRLEAVYEEAIARRSDLSAALRQRTEAATP